MPHNPLQICIITQVFTSTWSINPIELHWKDVFKSATSGLLQLCKYWVAEIMKWFLDWRGYTSLQLCIKSISLATNVYTVKWLKLWTSLFCFSADVNCSNSGTLWTPTHCAAFQDHGKVIMKLMEYKPDVTLQDSRGRYVRRWNGGVVFTVIYYSCSRVTSVNIEKLN